MNEDSHLTARLATVVTLFTLLFAGPASSLSAQQRREFGLQAVATFARADLAAAGLYGALRFGERGRVSLSAMVGELGNVAALRGELLGHFILRPRAMSGVSGYAFGGAALLAGSGERGYLVIGLGLESRPGSHSGWAIEVGAGGGFRLAAGYRWRWPAGPARD